MPDSTLVASLASAFERKSKSSPTSVAGLPPRPPASSMAFGKPRQSQLRYDPPTDLPSGVVSQSDSESDSDYEYDHEISMDDHDGRYDDHLNHNRDHAHVGVGHNAFEDPAMIIDVQDDDDDSSDEDDSRAGVVDHLQTRTNNAVKVEVEAKVDCSVNTTRTEDLDASMELRGTEDILENITDQYLASMEQNAAPLMFPSQSEVGEFDEFDEFAAIDEELDRLEKNSMSIDGVQLQLDHRNSLREKEKVWLDMQVQHLKVLKDMRLDDAMLQALTEGNDSVPMIDYLLSVSKYDSAKVANIRNSLSNIQETLATAERASRRSTEGEKFVRKWHSMHQVALQRYIAFQRQHGIEEAIDELD